MILFSLFLHRLSENGSCAEIPDTSMHCGVRTTSQPGARMGFCRDLGCQLPHPGHVFHQVLVGKALAVLCVALCQVMTWVRDAGITWRERFPWAWPCAQWCWQGSHWLQGPWGRARGCQSCRAQAVGSRGMPSLQPSLCHMVGCCQHLLKEVVSTN